MNDTDEPDEARGQLALEVLGVAKRFSGVAALRDVDLRVRRGEIHGLVGENGAGKSTLLKILDGYYPAGTYEGEIRVDGAEVHLRSPRDAKTLGIAIVPQESSVLDTLSVAENICIVAQDRHILTSERRTRARASQLLKELDFPLRASELVANLSASQKQLLMIARALYTRPRILILDEPTASLSTYETSRFMEIARGLKRQGLTVLFVSHRLDEVTDLCDRLSVMRDGMVVDEIERDQFDPARIVAAMIGRTLAASNRQAATLPPGEEVLRVEELSVADPHRPSVLAVDRASFALRRGEVVGIAGLIGSGRSELLRACYGAMPRSGGRLVLEGAPVEFLSPRDALRSGVGLVTEDRKRDGLLFNLNVRENITLAYLQALGRVFIDGQAERRTAARAVEEFAIVGQTTEAPVGTLSGGNQQKVVLARALQRGPKVLLLDEPTVGVDVGAKSEIYRLIGELAVRGMAVVVVSSDPLELLTVCARIIVMRAGRLMEELDAASTTREQLTSALAFGRAAWAGES